MSDTLITADRLRALSERVAELERQKDFAAECYVALHDKWRAAEASLAAMMRQRNDLLAVIHRDGGHYREQHGAEKAVADAIALISRERTERDRLREALKRAAPVPAQASAPSGMVMVPRDVAQAAARKLKLVGNIYSGDKESRRLAEELEITLAVTPKGSEE